MTRDGDRIVWARLDLPGSSMPGTGRSPDVTGLTQGELERTRRELAASLALARPDSPARVPILAHLAAIDAELAGQSARQPSCFSPGRADRRSVSAAAPHA